MTAPLPLRFYNPVKDLCQKANLDYETVLGNSLSPQMREAYINAEIPKIASEFVSADKKAVRRKIEFYNKKYGDGNVCLGENTAGTSEDKGRIRYDAGANVEYPLPDDSKGNESNTLSNGLDGNGHSGKVRFIHPPGRWVPGKGIVY